VGWTAIAHLGTLLPPSVLCVIAVSALVGIERIGLRMLHRSSRCSHACASG
jgi:hypothetical protein